MVKGPGQQPKTVLQDGHLQNRAPPGTVNWLRFGLLVNIYGIAALAFLTGICGSIRRVVTLERAMISKQLLWIHLHYAVTTACTSEAPNLRIPSIRQMRALRRAVLALLVMAGSLSCGCAIYSETRDKQGQAVKESWARVDLKAQIDVPRKNLQALLAEQLSVEDDLWSARRTQLARSMAYSQTVSGLTSSVRQELGRVGTEKAAEPLRSALAALNAAREGYASQAAVSKQLGNPLPSCPNLMDSQKGAEFDARIAALPDENVRAALAVTVQGAKPHCTVILKGLSDVPITGELSAALAVLDQEQEALSDDENKTAELRKQYKTALAAYESAASEFLADQNKSRDKVDSALKQLGSLADLLKNADDSFSIKFVSEERLTSLDRFLSTYSDVTAGKGTEDGTRLAIALAVFPDLVDKARTALKDVQKPNLVPLAVQKSVEQAKLDGAQRDVATRNELISLRQAHVDSLLAQVKAYQQALDALTAKGVAPMGNARLRQALSPVTDKEVSDAADSVFESKQKLWKATALYLDAEGRLRAETGKIRYRMTALERERSLTLAESNINQWKALIDPSVDLMAAYGASGLKSSDIQALINSLTLLWIGVGVNQ